MNKLTKEEKEEIALLEKNPDFKDGTLGITSSSSMHQFCEDAAWKIANFYRAEYYPLSATELKPFLKQITKEFKKIWKESTYKINKS